MTVDVPDQRPATVTFASGMHILIRTDTVAVPHTGVDQTVPHTLAHAIFAAMAVVALTHLTVSSVSHTHQRISMEPAYVTIAGEEMTVPTILEYATQPAMAVTALRPMTVSTV